jgi:CRISPR-associated endoribonuclease Cas6
MRLHFQLTSNETTVPFDHHHFLTGRFHKWLGENSVHDSISLYSLGWLRGGKTIEGGLTFPDGAEWFISSYDNAILEKLIGAARSDTSVCCGMHVEAIRIQDTPDFGPRFNFKVGSAVLARSKQVDGRVTHLLHSDEAADDALTQALRHKMDVAGIENEHKQVRVKFDRTYQGARTKLVTIKGIGNRASICPVIVEGTPEAVQFAWNVGVGHLTGNGFGSLL